MFRPHLRFNDAVSIWEAPSITGLSFRYYRGYRDYDRIVQVLNESREVDGVERLSNADELARNYARLPNCDLKQDLLLAEFEGKVIGYTRVNWEQELEAEVYRLAGNLIPEWRRKGIGRALLHWGEARLRQVAGTHSRQQPGFFQSSAEATEAGRISLLQHEGYATIRSFYEMVRSDLEHLPKAPLPPGLEVRPVNNDQLPRILAAYDEAMRDHWNYSPMTEGDIQALVNGSRIDASLWQVAWEGNQIAGMVCCYIDMRENERYQRQRGVTEPIAVRRPWRGRGLASSLLVLSLQALKSHGMTEASLSVDTQNPTGALPLYERLGFQAVQSSFIFRKPLDLNL